MVLLYTVGQLLAVALQCGLSCAFPHSLDTVNIASHQLSTRAAPEAKLLSKRYYMGLEGFDGTDLSNAWSRYIETGMIEAVECANTILAAHNSGQLGSNNHWVQRFLGRTAGAPEFARFLTLVERIAGFWDTDDGVRFSLVLDIDTPADSSGFAQFSYQNGNVNDPDYEIIWYQNRGMHGHLGQQMPDNAVADDMERLAETAASIAFHELIHWASNDVIDPTQTYVDDIEFQDLPTGEQNQLQSFNPSYNWSPDDTFYGWYGSLQLGRLYVPNGADHPAMRNADSMTMLMLALIVNPSEIGAPDSSPPPSDDDSSSEDYLHLPENPDWRDSLRNSSPPSDSKSGCNSGDCGKSTALHVGVAEQFSWKNNHDDF